MRKIIGFIGFILTGSILLASSFTQVGSVAKQGAILVIGLCYCIGLMGHFKELKG